MKKFIGLFLLLYGCSTLQVPESFVYREIQTDKYTLAGWQKITDNHAPVRIYIEGDGHAFNYAGYPTNDPTPKGTFLREVAFNDPNPNVVYLARPCQFVKDPVCTQTDWTTGRFSKEIVLSTSQAIKTLTQGKEMILIGYSGGALLSGLVIQENPDFKVKQWITIAGLLNHTKWTKALNLDPLTKSLDLNKLPSVPQKHYVGQKDDVISIDLYTDRVPKNDLIVIEDATHDRGFDQIVQRIYNF